MVAAGFYNQQPYGSTTSATRESCRACNGKGILLDPVAPVGGTRWRVDWNWVTSGYQSSGTFDPTRYRNSTTAVAA